MAPTPLNTTTSSSSSSNNNNNNTTTTAAATTRRAASAPASLPTGLRIIWLRPPLPGTYTTPSPPTTISPITPAWSPITPPAAATDAATTSINIHSTAPNPSSSPSALSHSLLNSPVELSEQRAPGQGSRRSLVPPGREEAMRRLVAEWEDEMEGVEETEEEGDEDEEDEDVDVDVDVDVDEEGEMEEGEWVRRMRDGTKSV